MSEPAIRLVLADDHPVVRSGLRAMLETAADIEVVGEAADGNEAVRVTEEILPDVLLLDLQMPGLDGRSVAEEVSGRFPQVGILILTTFATDSDVLEAIHAGASGYMLKDAPREELFEAIRSTARGEASMTPAVATKLLSSMRNDERALTRRELEVLSCVASGQSNKEIAETLFVSEATVKSHLVHIFTKLGVEDRTAAVTVALERGLIRLGG